MNKPEDTTFSVPRFLSFIDLAYLFEAAKATDEYFASKISAISISEDRNEIGNINATRQSLLRAVFISSYANKVLGKNIDTTKAHWKNLLILQEVRNHLVHYGPKFSDSNEHQKRFDKFSNSKFVTLRPVICFTIEQIESVIQLYIDCVNDFS